MGPDYQSIYEHLGDLRIEPAALVQHAAGSPHRRLRPIDTVTVRNDLARLPYYDADLEALGDPAAVTDLRQAVAVADLVVVVTPEYNGTVPGLLGNAIDWLSPTQPANPCYATNRCWSCPPHPPVRWHPGRRTPPACSPASEPRCCRPASPCGTCTIGFSVTNGTRRSSPAWPTFLRKS